MLKCSDREPKVGDIVRSKYGCVGKVLYISPTSELVYVKMNPDKNGRTRVNSCHKQRFCLHYDILEEVAAA